MNSINVVGNLTRDPERRQTANGTIVAHFTIALNSTSKEDTAIFLDVNAFGVQAEFVTTYARKGDKLGVTGRLAQDAYTAKDGRLVRKLFVIADRVDLLSPKKAEPAETADLNPTIASATRYSAPEATTREGASVPAYRRVK